MKEDKSKSIVLKKREQFNTAFIKFQNIHFTYLLQITDEQEEKKLFESMEEISKERDEFMKKIESWMEDKGKESTSTESVDREQRVIEMFSTLVNLPKLELDYFYGNPLYYWSFINSFKGAVEEETVSERKRLQYLIHYCKGEAKECIENCILLPVSEGYSSALKMLKANFGRPHIVTQAYIEDLVDGPVLKSFDNKGLKVLSRKMQRTQIVLRAMGNVSDLNSIAYLKRIVQKLPFHLQSKWAEKAEQLMSEDAYPSFSDVAHFVEHQANVANGIFGQLLNDNRSQGVQRSKDIKYKEKTLSIEEKERPLEGSHCYCCGEYHRLYECKKFQDLNQGQKFSILKQHDLCLNCFGKGHGAKGCFKGSACRVHGCKAKHHSLLHRYDFASNPKLSEAASRSIQQQRISTEAGGSEAASHSVQQQRHQTEAGGVCLRIIPVVVSDMEGKNSVETYALLDSGSNVSLCDERLQRLLGINGHPRNFNISTVNRRDQMKKGNEISMKVSSNDRKETISIDKVWSVDTLNISTEYMPSNSDVKKWKHLINIHLPTSKLSEVLLLIGGNVPEAFWVIEERRGDKGEPYGIKGPLGWSIIGPIVNHR
ncbi:Uncharacterised protein r2_g3366 [Pycnogonum litorale]